MTTGAKRPRGAAGECEGLAAALAELRRAEADLRAANEGLRRANGELRRIHLTVAEGFDALDRWSAGRLREVVERAGDELAALVDLVLDDSEELAR
jgi:hypothetical protein